VPDPTTAPMIIKSRIVPSQGEAGRAIRKNATATTVIEAVPKTITSEAVRCPIRLGREISGLFSVAPTSNSEPFFECHQIAPDSPFGRFEVEDAPFSSDHVVGVLGGASRTTPKICIARPAITTTTPSV